MHFFDTITYTSKEEKPEDDNASVIINLPTIGDAKGSTYTFNLSGPVAVPDNYTVTVGTGTPINPVVLYSTSAQTAADGTTPDTTGYVTADQVKDWSTIRSIAIEINGIKANTSTGRIEITGTANDFNKQAGHTGYLQTIFYGNGSQANVSSTDASIAITGTSTIKTRLHYVDAAGKDQYVDLDDLSKTLNDNADTFTNDYPTQLSDFSTNDQGLIPAGYKLVTDASGKATLTLIDGKDASGKADGTAEFGQVVQYFYDGDIVQYELTSNVSAKIEYVDDDNKGAIVGDPTTVPGVPGGTTDWNTDKLPAGYKLADGQAASGTYEFTGDADQTVKIHLSHVLENSTTTTTRTITYVVAGPNYTGKVPVAQTQTITWKITTDKATGTSFATPTGVYGEVSSPKIDGYTADQKSVSQETYNDVATSDIPANEDVTVTYSPDKQTVTVEYVDDDDNGRVVDTPAVTEGVTSGKVNWNTDNLPAGYKLAAGQPVSGTYQFTNDKGQIIKIHLNHVIENTTVTTTRTIKYVVNDPNYTGKVPAAQTQTITWKVTSDQAAKTSFATPTGVYGKQETPTIDGYKADKDSVDQETYNVVTTSELPVNEEVTVTYTPLQQTVTLEYVDDAKGGEVVGTPTTITGTTSGTVTWNTDDLPTGYKLAAGQPASGTYQFTNDENQMIQIHLSHVINSSAATTTRTITYVVNDPNYTGQVPATQTQTITWKIITDKTTGNQVMVPQGDYGAQTTSVISGYTADKTSVSQQAYGAVTTLPQNEEVTVTYTPNAQNVTFEYVDDDNGGKVVGTPTTVALNTSSKFNWNTDDKPTSYNLAAGQAANGTYQVTANSNQMVQVHLNHVIDRTTTTTTRTIHYVVNDPNYTGQVPATWVQTVTWNVVTDRATGTSVATPAGSYYEVTVPTLSDYTASPSKVGQQALDSVSASDVPMYNEDVVVTYAPIKQTGSDGGEGVPDNEPGDNPSGGDAGTITTGTPDSGTAVTPPTGTVTTEVTTEKGEGSPLETSNSEGTAEAPERISETGKATTTPVSGHNASGSVSESRSNDSATNQQKLPQTNEQSHSEVGLGLLGLLTSMLGLVGLKRRKRDDE